MSAEISHRELSSIRIGESNRNQTKHLTEAEISGGETPSGVLPLERTRRRKVQMCGKILNFAGKNSHLEHPSTQEEGKACVRRILPKSHPLVRLSGRHTLGAEMGNNPKTQRLPPTAQPTPGFRSLLWSIFQDLPSLTCCAIQSFDLVYPSICL